MESCPARGDFLSRRLDAEFIAGWDEWLQRAMRDSREALGERWLGMLSLGAGVALRAACRDVLEAGLGGALVAASVDRVGRYFRSRSPRRCITKATTCPRRSQGAALARLARSARARGADPELDFDAFDQRLAALRMPAGVPAAAAPSDDTVPLGAAQSPFQAWQFAPDVIDETVTRVLMEPSRELRTASGALADPRRRNARSPCLAACAGPISGERFCALLDGRWPEHSWTVASATSLILNANPPLPRV
jgi:type VI secretion system ImpM family protein